jgi:hypothetical protein
MVPVNVGLPSRDIFIHYELRIGLTDWSSVEAVPNKKVETKIAAWNTCKAGCKPQGPKAWQW